MSEEQTPISKWMGKLEAWTKANQYTIYRKGLFHDVIPTSKLPEYAVLIKDLVAELNSEAQTKASIEQVHEARQQYQCDEIEIDDDAEVSEAADALAVVKQINPKR